MIQTSPLFPDAFIDTPATEGIKYAGSKLKLLPYILQLASKVPASTVLDGFTGTTRAAQAFAQRGYRVIANDIAVWSKIFGDCYLGNRKPRQAYEELIHHLNSLPPVDGWFSKRYGGQPNGGSAVQADGLKKPFQIHNTRKLDAIREEIDRLNLPMVEKAVALTSLILALDEVDNTMGHFASYLNEWSPRSNKEMILQVPQVITNTKEHQVFQGDIFDIIKSTSADLAYYDPPYGSNNDKMPPSRVRYASYYHIWTTVCLNDKPKLFGKAKRRVDSSDTLASSVFEDFRQNGSKVFIVVEAIERLLRESQTPWIILSYSSGGRATAAELYDVISNSGNILETVEVDYKRNVMAGMRWTNEWVKDAAEPNREFLFLIEKK